jgi:hypothetical protein
VRSRVELVASQVAARYPAPAAGGVDHSGEHQLHGGFVRKRGMTWVPARAEPTRWPPVSPRVPATTVRRPGSERTTLLHWALITLTAHAGHHWLLVRRHLRHGELALYRCYCPRWSRWQSWSESPGAGEPSRKAQGWQGPSRDALSTRRNPD